MDFLKLGGMAHAWTFRNDPDGPEDASVASLPGGRQSSANPICIGRQPPIFTDNQQAALREQTRRRTVTDTALGTLNQPVHGLSPWRLTSQTKQENPRQHDW